MLKPIFDDFNNLEPELSSYFKDLNLEIDTIEKLNLSERIRYRATPNWLSFILSSGIRIFSKKKAAHYRKVSAHDKDNDDWLFILEIESIDNLVDNINELDVFKF